MLPQKFALFTKPWPQLSLPALAQHVRRLGFRWIELPVRPGFQVEPQAISSDLPRARQILADAGVGILNITADLPLDDERLYAACAECDIPLNRVMFKVQGRPYWQAEAEARRQLEAALPLCQQYGVKLGVQNHSNAYVPVNAMGQYHLLKDYDPQYIGAIWDPAHNALEGAAPELALDIIAKQVLIVNLKNAYWRRVSGPEAAVANWQIYWTSGPQGRASWQAVANKLQAMGYSGPLCFSAEYTNEADTDRLITQDLAFASTIFGAWADEDC